MKVGTLGEESRMKFELVRCTEGDRWFPWNYGRRIQERRVGMARIATVEPGLLVINAVDRRGRVLGSCCLRIGARYSEYLLGDEEYRYGALAAGPSYFWNDDPETPWILTLKSFWVRPEARRQGVARAFAEAVREFGLPTYLCFANKMVQAWFDREYRPNRKTSELQKTIKKLMRSQAEDPELGQTNDFIVHLQAEADSFEMWKSSHGGSLEVVTLERILFEPDRIDDWAADSGEEHELGFSDSAFAEDRSFGYELLPSCHSWGPEEGPWDEVPIDVESGDLEKAEEDYRGRPSFTAGTAEGWVTDPQALKFYATVRHFLRTFEWREFKELDDAMTELFVRDLSESPRGLRRFHALISSGSG